MRPSRHIIASLTIGAALWFFTRSLYAGLLCFASGVLVDLDHILEYAIHHGWRDITLENMYTACEETERGEGNLRFKRLYIIFHISEIAILLWIAAIYTKNIFVLAVALGYSSHLILDAIGNKVYPIAYSIFWRAINKFDTNKIFRKDLDNQDGRG